LLGIPPAIGREFTPEEDVPGGPTVCILNYPLWKNLFGGDPDIVGRPIQLRGATYTVIGVTPGHFPITERTSFSGGYGVDLWTPLRPSTTGEAGGINYSTVARLKDGVSWGQAEAELRQISPAAFVNVPPGGIAELTLTPMQEAMIADVRQPLLMLWGAVGVVLLIACVNIAGLLLARGATRTREIAIRMAVGSGRAAVIRQLLVESAALALLGGGLGIVVGWGVLSAIGSLGAQVFEIWQPLGLNGQVLLAMLAIALGTSLVFGLAPAVQASRLDVQAGLREGGSRAVAGSANRWPRRVLVVVEVALGVLLLVSAGLLIRTFVHLRDLAPGFDDRNLVTLSVSLQDARYKDPAPVSQLFGETLRRMRAVPGVEQAGVALGMPYTRLLNEGFMRIDGPHVDETGQITNESYVTPGYFEALKVPLRQGRLVSEADTAGAPMIAVVNEAFVARYYKDDPNVLGRHIRSGNDVREIVGIVGNVQQGSAGWGNFAPITPLPCMYVP
jgi:predicted permease